MHSTVGIVSLEWSHRVLIDQVLAWVMQQLNPLLYNHNTILNKAMFVNLAISIIASTHQ